MKPRFRIKELHLKNGTTIYVPQRRHWIFWVNCRESSWASEIFFHLSDAQEYLQEIERREKMDAEWEVVGTRFIDYKEGNQ